MEDFLYVLIPLAFLYYLVNGVKGLGGTRKIPYPPEHLRPKDTTAENKDRIDKI